MAFLRNWWNGSGWIRRHNKKQKGEQETMEITENREGGKLTIALDGRLDTITSQQLEKELRTSIDGVTDLVFDLEKLSYITSAGLRVLSVAQKVMNRQGHLAIIHSQPDVMEVFDVTGLTDVMEIS